MMTEEEFELSMKQTKERLDSLKPINLINNNAIIEEDGVRKLNKEIMFSVQQPCHNNTVLRFIWYDESQRAWAIKNTVFLTFTEEEALEIFEYQLYMEREEKAKAEREKAEKEKREKEEREAYENAIPDKTKEKWENASEFKKEYYINFNEKAAVWIVIFFFSFIITGTLFIRIGIIIHIIYGLMQQGDLETYLKWRRSRFENLIWDEDQKRYRLKYEREEDYYNGWK